MIVIYALVDPLEPERIRYIGKTSKQKPAQRLYEHVADARRGVRNYRCNWVRSVLNAGRYPALVVVASAVSTDWQGLERQIIAQHVGLLNATPGGDGIELSPELIRQRVESRKWYKHSPEVRARISAGHKGKTLSAEHRAKLAAIAQVREPEHYAKVAASRKGQRLSEGTRRKLRIAQLKSWAPGGSRRKAVL